MGSAGDVMKSFKEYLIESTKPIIYPDYIWATKRNDNILIYRRLRNPPYPKGTYGFMYYTVYGEFYKNFSRTVDKYDSLINTLKHLEDASVEELTRKEFEKKFEEENFIANI